jgi:predicted nucleic acid binding AN1-type Zn finger protein
MSSSVPSSNSGRDQQMLAVGRQCSHPSCHLVDFLPFKCQHCANSFCADHFKPASHSCTKYDEAKYNRVAPDCPLCNEPVPIPPGEDPNIRMERHLAIDCSVMTGRSQKPSTTPKCSRPKCGKLLFAQIQCDKCRQKFCPEHRFPSSHNCSSISSTASPPTSSTIKPSPQDRAIGASGLAAIKRAAASVKSSALSPTKTSTAPPPTPGTAFLEN